MKYKNELERILSEDCEIDGEFVPPKDRVWKTSAQIEKEKLEMLLAKQEEQQM